MFVSTVTTTSDSTNLFGFIFHLHLLFYCCCCELMQTKPRHMFLVLECKLACECIIHTSMVEGIVLFTFCLKSFYLPKTTDVIQNNQISCLVLCVIKQIMGAKSFFLTCQEH